MQPIENSLVNETYWLITESYEKRKQEEANYQYNHPDDFNDDRFND